MLPTDRQPMVSVIQGVLDKVTEKWNVHDDKIEERMDLMLQIQRDRLALEQSRLDFECQMAGIKIPAKKTVKKKGWF